MEALEINHHNVYLKGHHMIRKSYSRYSGQATDIAIERVLMRFVKSKDGLSPWRDCEEGQWLIWLLSRPICAELNHSLQTLTGKHMETSDQHLRDHEWSTPAHMARDAKDLQINLYALILYLPFTDDPSLRSITSGIVAATNVNVDDARAIGMKILSGMY